MIYFAIFPILATVVVIIAKRSAMLRPEVFNAVNFHQLPLTKYIKKPRPAFSAGKTKAAFLMDSIIRQDYPSNGFFMDLISNIFEAGKSILTFDKQSTL